MTFEEFWEKQEPSVSFVFSTKPYCVALVKLIAYESWLDC